MGLDDDKLRDGVTLNEAATKFVKCMLDEFFNMRSILAPHEALGLDPNHEGNESDDWLDDVATELAEQLKDQ